jgi:hypothetical protein
MLNRKVFGKTRFLLLGIVNSAFSVSSVLD